DYFCAIWHRTAYIF
nr:immunoglobulin light chain junction region [Macaca mulatta]MOX80054.1 immunoglobulin light chain junction region [Macaca mulatta]